MWTLRHFNTKLCALRWQFKNQKEKVWKIEDFIFSNLGIAESMLCLLKLEKTKMPSTKIVWWSSQSLKFSLNVSLHWSLIFQQLNIWHSLSPECDWIKEASSLIFNLYIIFEYVLRRRNLRTQELLNEGPMVNVIEPSQHRKIGSLLGIFTFIPKVLMRASIQ